MSGHARNTVVSLGDYSRKISAKDLTDISQPLGQINYARKIMREWIGLPDDQFKLLFFIFGKTIAWGVTGTHLTYRMLANGDHTSRGIGKSERPLRASLTALEKFGAITVDRTDQATKGLFISINLEWSPEENVVPTPKRLQQGRDTAAYTSSSDADNNGWECDTPAVDSRPPRSQTAGPSGREQPDIKAGLSKHDSPKHDRGTPAPLARNRTSPSASLDFEAASGWEDSEPAVRPVSPSSSPVALAPSSTTVDSLMGAAMQKTRRRLTKAERKLQPGAIEATFRAAFAQHFDKQPGAVLPAWTVADLGMVNTTLVKRFIGRTAEAHALVRWSVENWQSVMAHSFRWMKREKPPEFPVLGFFLRFLSDFISAHGRDLTDRWIRAMKDHEEREFRRLTVKDGLTKDEAFLRIAANRATEAMRDENRRAKEENRILLQKARLVEARVKRMGDQSVHPESQVARGARAREEEARLQKLREEHGVKPLEPGEVPDLMASLEQGIKNHKGWD